MLKFNAQNALFALVGIVCLIVFSVVIGGSGFIAGRWLGQSEGWGEAQWRVAQVFPPTPNEVYALNGRIQRVGDRQIVVDTQPVSSNPLGLTDPSVRTVIMDDSTVIEERALKPAAQRAQENAAYRIALERAQSDASVNPIPPLGYTAKALKLSDLKVGDAVTVVANENIKTKESFAAAQISRTTASR